MYIHMCSDHGQHSPSKYLWTYRILQAAAGIRIWAALLVFATTEVPRCHVCARTEVFVDTRPAVTSTAHNCRNNPVALDSSRFRRAQTPPFPGVVKE